MRKKKKSGQVSFQNSSSVRHLSKHFTYPFISIRNPKHSSSLHLGQSSIDFFSSALNMQCIKNSILWHVTGRRSTKTWLCTENGNMLKKLSSWMYISTGTNTDQVMDRVIGLVKKFDKIDASKVTVNADFQKDLSLDSLDRVELVMAFEQEFSIEIPDEKADKLTCCADVAEYIEFGTGQNMKS